MQHARATVRRPRRERRVALYCPCVGREPVDVVEGFAAGTRVEGRAAHGGVDVPVRGQVGGWGRRAVQGGEEGEAVAAEGGVGWGGRGGRGGERWGGGGEGGGSGEGGGRDDGVEVAATEAQEGAGGGVQVGDYDVLELAGEVREVVRGGGRAGAEVGGGTGWKGWSSARRVVAFLLLSWTAG